MHGTLCGSSANESGEGVKSDVRKYTGSARAGACVKSDVPDSGWFVEMVLALHPHKPGTMLHYLTGYNERLCQKYAAGSVKPSAYFLRNLLRSKEGWRHLVEIMDGCEAPWWRELVVRKECADAYEARRREITRRDSQERPAT